MKISQERMNMRMTKIPDTENKRNAHINKNKKE